MHAFPQRVQPPVRGLFLSLFFRGIGKKSTAKAKSSRPRSRSHYSSGDSGDDEMQMDEQGGGSEAAFDAGGSGNDEGGNAGSGMGASTSTAAGAHGHRSKSVAKVRLCRRCVIGGRSRRPYDPVSLNILRGLQCRVLRHYPPPLRLFRRLSAPTTLHYQRSATLPPCPMPLARTPPFTPLQEALGAALEADISTLLGLGFPRRKAKEALQACDGDVQGACEWLLENCS